MTPEAPGTSERVAPEALDRKPIDAEKTGLLLMQEKYKQGFEEMRSNDKNAGDLEKYALLAIAGIYTWVFGRGIGNGGDFQFSSYALWIPSFIAVVVVKRIRQIVLANRAIGVFQRRMHNAYFPWVIPNWTRSPDPMTRDKQAGLFDRWGIGRTWLVILLMVGVGKRWNVRQFWKGAYSLSRKVRRLFDRWGISGTWLLILLGTIGVGWYFR